jgi:hypothetical protein
MAVPTQDLADEARLPPFGRCAAAPAYVEDRIRASFAVRTIDLKTGMYRGRRF